VEQFKYLGTTLSKQSSVEASPLCV